MADLGDLKLDKSVEPADTPSRTRWRAALVLLLVGVIAAAAYFLLWKRRAPAPEGVRVHTEQEVVPGAPKPVPEPGEEIELKPLDETDPVVRELVQKLSSHPRVAAWLATDQLIRNFTVVVVNIATGRTPSSHLRRVAPTGEFVTAGDGAALHIDPRSYRRYDDYADAVAGLDARGTARLYATLKPRIQDAYRELGYPDGDVDVMMQRAIAELLATPIVEGDIRLEPKSVAYEFADPRLKALSGAQRQFLRMGPRNIRLIQAKLREIAPHLGMTVGADQE